jgi:hypothetical protein
VTVFECEQTDIAASQYCYHDRGFEHEIQARAITFYTSKHWYRSPTDRHSITSPNEVCLLLFTVS